MTNKVNVVDPGKLHCAVAEYLDGKLTRAVLIEDKDEYAVASKAALWIGYCDDLVLEGQQVYGRGVGDPNDLLPLARCIGAVGAATPHKRRHIVLPRIWTSGVPKPVRIRKYLQRADKSEEELIERLCLRKDMAHNVIDAICLGAWWLNRYDLGEYRDS